MRGSTRGQDIVADLRVVLEEPSLRRIFLARTISVCGDMMVPIALAFAVLRLTGSATALGLVLAARALPPLLFLLHGGAFGDRYSRRAVMVASQLTAAGSQVTLGVLILSGVDNLLALCALVAVRGSTSAFFNPTSTAAIVVVIDQARRQTAFSLFAIIGAASEIAGPALAGVAMLMVDPGWVVVLDGLTFLVSAALIARCSGLGTGASRDRVRGAMRAEIRDGLSFVVHTSWLSALIVAAAVFQFALLSSLNVLGPLVAERSLGGPSAWATVVGAMGLGGVVGAILGVRLRPSRPLLVAYGVGALAAGPTLILLAIPAPLWAIVASEFVAGAAVTLFGTIETTTISNHVPAELLSRVDSVNRLGSMALKPAGMALVAPAAAVVGLRPTLLGAAALGLAAMLTPPLLPSVRGLTPTPAAPRPRAASN